ncbi:MAG TPA: hypothetical protein V6D48_05865 [Oculatellaceae cyanobacterium]
MRSLFPDRVGRVTTPINPAVCYPESPLPVPDTLTEPLVDQTRLLKLKSGTSVCDTIAAVSLQMVDTGESKKYER